MSSQVLWIPNCSEAVERPLPSDLPLSSIGSVESIARPAQQGQNMVVWRTQCSPRRTSVILLRNLVHFVGQRPERTCGYERGYWVKETTLPVGHGRDNGILTRVRFPPKPFRVQHPRSTIGCRSLGCTSCDYVCTVTAPTHMPHVISCRHFAAMRLSRSHIARRSREHPGYGAAHGCFSLDPSRDRSPLTESKDDYRNRLEERE